MTFEHILFRRRPGVTQFHAPYLSHRWFMDMVESDYWFYSGHSALLSAFHDEARGRLPLLLQDQMSSRCRVYVESLFLFTSAERLWRDDASLHSHGHFDCRIWFKKSRSHASDRLMLTGQAREVGIIHFVIFMKCCVDKPGRYRLQWSSLDKANAGFLSRLRKE